MTLQIGDRVEVVEDIVDGVKIRKGHRGVIVEFRPPDTTYPIAANMDGFGVVVFGSTELRKVEDTE